MLEPVGYYASSRVFVDRVFVERMWEEGWRLIHGFIRNIDREVERNEENKKIKNVV